MTDFESTRRTPSRALVGAASGGASILAAGLMLAVPELGISLCLILPLYGVLLVGWIVALVSVTRCGPGKASLVIGRSAAILSTLAVIAIAATWASVHMRAS